MEQPEEETKAPEAPAAVEQPEEKPKEADTLHDHVAAEQAERDRLTRKDADLRGEAARAREDNKDPEPDDAPAEGSLHPNARPPQPSRPRGGTFPNVPRDGYKPNPANHAGAHLPPERQAPRPDDEDIGAGAVIKK